MYDSSHEELLTRIDYDRKLFILSTRCRGRHAVLAALTMMLSAWQHERGTQPLNYDQLSSAASIMERFLVDMGLEEAAVQRLASPPSALKPKTKWRNVRRTALAVAFFGAATLLWWTVRSDRTPSDPPSHHQTVTLTTPLSNLAQDKHLATVTFGNVTGSTAAHPVDPAFAASSADLKILRINADGTKKTLAQTHAPVLWLSLSPDGQHLAACDAAQNLYLVAWDSHTPPQQIPTDGHPPVMLSVDNAGVITWLDSQSKLFATDISKQTTTRLLGYEQTVNASPDGEIICVIRSVPAVPAGRSVELQINNQPLPINAQLLPDQWVHDADASIDHQTIAVLLNDGLLLVFQQIDDGRYRLQEHQFPPPQGTAQVCVAPDGRAALVVSDKAYRIDLQRLRITAALDFPATAGPVCDAAWRPDLDEIAIAHAKEGFLWQP